MTLFEFAGVLLDGWGSSKDGEAVHLLNDTVEEVVDDPFRWGAAGTGKREAAACSK